MMVEHFFDARQNIVNIPRYFNDFKGKYIGVSGSRRRFLDEDKKTLISLFQQAISRDKHAIVSGECKSIKFHQGIKYINQNADQWAKQYAIENDIPYIPFPPEKPVKNNKYAWIQEFYKRNQQIVDRSDILIALMAGFSGGTFDTVKRAIKKGIPVLVNMKNGNGWMLVTFNAWKVYMSSINDEPRSSCEYKTEKNTCNLMINEAMCSYWPIDEPRCPVYKIKIVKKQRVFF